MRQRWLTLHCLDYIKSYPTILRSINSNAATRVITYIAMPSRKTFRCSVHIQLEQHREGLASTIETSQLVASSTSGVVHAQFQKSEYLDQNDGLQMRKKMSFKKGQCGRLIAYIAEHQHNRVEDAPSYV